MNNIIKKIEEIIQELKPNPFLYMSLGSKELFHSNFWAWLFELDREFIKNFFSELKINPTDNIKITREEGKRDITIWINNEAYVIENKFKSLPDENQLINYQTNLDKGKIFKQGIITGIINPNFNNNHWQFVSYEKIYKEILETLKKVKDKLTPFNYNLIKEYCTFLEKLQDLLALFTKLSKEENELNLTQRFSSSLSDIRMESLCKKINMNVFSNYLKENLKVNNKTKDGIKISQDYTRGESLINIEYEKNFNEGYITKIGIQIQGTQYRRIIVKQLDRAKNLNGKVISKDDNLKKDIFDEYKGKGWFEEKIEKTLFGHSTSQKENFCSYCVENDYIFIYQYYNIQDFSFDANLTNIRNDLEIAKEIIEKYR